MEEMKALKQQNQESELRNKELQEKYNALMERMAGYIERENGKGRRVGLLWDRYGDWARFVIIQERGEWDGSYRRYNMRNTRRYFQMCQ